MQAKTKHKQMIKFFQKIRQNMLTEGKTGKYLKYAIGEIILVVIGILVALQVNNWNNERLENNRANEFVKKVNIQIDNNLTKVTDYIDRFTDQFEQTLELVSIIGTSDTSNIDPKINLLVELNLSDYHLNLNMNTILEGKENGDFALIASEELRQHLYELINLNDQIKERERITNEDLNTLFVPYLNKKYNLRNSSGPDILEKIGRSNIYKGDNYKLLQDQEFENYIMFRIYYNEGNRMVYGLIQDKLEVIDSLIEIDLDDQVL